MYEGVNQIAFEFVNRGRIAVDTEIIVEILGVFVAMVVAAGVGYLYGKSRRK